MPIVTVLFPSILNSSEHTFLLRATWVESAIKPIVAGVTELELKEEDVTVVVPKCYVGGDTIIVDVTKLFERMERTRHVRRDLSQRLFDFFKEQFAEYRVEVFVTQFDDHGDVCVAG